MEAPIKDYIEFLKYCLDTSGPIPECVSGINWHALLDFARRQAITGIFWQGLETLGYVPKNKPTDDVLLLWLSEVKKIHKRNILLFEKSQWMCNNFYKENFSSCILKGQGIALYYPNPEYRTCGDIDIWIEPVKSSSDRRKLKIEDRRKAIVKYVRKYCKSTPIRYHHIDFPIIKSVPIEIHFMPCYLNNPYSNRKLQKYFDSVRVLQFSNIVSYKSAEHTYSFIAPLDSFNRIFEMCHIVRHYFDEGIGLRQLIDYYYLLRKTDTLSLAYGNWKVHDMNVFKELRLTKFVSAVMWVLHDALGLAKKYLLCEPNEKYGRLLLDEILCGGNFGRYAVLPLSRQSIIRKYIKKTVRNLEYARMCPSEALWEPWFRTWHFFWRIGKLYK